ncbi:hypothetical protein KRE40_04740 [Elizabethkingia meningoseptica]|uniref:DUF6705 family protein n=1 Tax=Elizabethkingia meningoseptica TaxID=238 RepID=UPI000999E019|nr:DUF6705 family protein [Elizabethkingia meningoseptica]MDE5430804.1 hypothetical protein [Elizabethkingia meningoseptica]MDE5438821.1 hypothetical protein [Elizabethkingia meningoseptica]MDE5507956.1 hypothetical protein [Elizabethkingia meningoseptica]MDE5516176.1 hypothetical protein [Elizabethkingia meningoseptica]MDE5526441.1 hypothetical protein [Elizabethkingia meningoseptica]
MKKILLFIFFSLKLSCYAQTYPLRTFTSIPENAYLKDTNNELSQYEGTWVGAWNNKTIYLTFKKLTNQYDDVFKYYRDYLIVKSKVVDNNTGNVLFDNTNVADDKTKIFGGKFRKFDDKYSLIYIDKDLCGKSGRIVINFTDSSNTKLQWVYSENNQIIESDCFYWGKSASERPDPLPFNIILNKQ